MPTVSAGSLQDLPLNSCVAVAAGRAVVVRVGDQAYAYRNECRHQASPLAGGLVKDGVITCPLHFWRYEASSGVKCGEPELRLDSYPVRLESGTVLVEIPEPAPVRSMREMMLDHARDWDRGDR